MISLRTFEAAEPADPETSILILSSYSAANEWTHEELSGLLSGLGAEEPGLVPSVEFLDSLRFPGPRHEDRMIRYLQEKYGSSAADVLIVLDDEALGFAASNADWVGDAQVVFGGVNDYRPGRTGTLEQVTGIVEGVDVAGTVRLAMRLLPELETLHVLHDTPEDMDRVHQLAGASLPEALQVEGLFSNVWSRVAALRKGEALLFFEYNQDEDGNLIPQDGSFQRRLVNQAAGPVFFLYDRLPGFGLGGRVQSARQHGQSVAALALRVIRGEAAGSIPVVTNASHQAVVDYDQMRRFNIPMARLPAETLLLSPPPPLHERYRFLGYLVIGFVLGLVALIFVLVRQSKRRAELLRALQAGKELLQTVMDEVPHNIFAKDRQGRFVFVNRMFAQAHGLRPEEMIGRTTFDLTPDERQAGQFHRDDMEVVATGKTKRVQSEAFTTASGVTGVYQTIKMPLQIEGNDDLAMLGVSADVTEIEAARNKVRRINEELERRVRKRTEELESANRELETFSYTVSHDLRAPLRAIDGFSQLLLDERDIKWNGKGREYLEKIRDETVRMGELTDDLLNLARISRQEVEWSEVDLTSLAKAVYAELTMNGIPDRKVNTVWSPSPAVEGDPRLLRILLKNLLENALKYTRGRDPTLIEFGHVEREGGIEYFVRDNGAGFDMKYAGKLFQPFQRFHSTREFTGHGIGLATVRRILQRHGGDIRAESAPEKGAAFHFWFGNAGEPGDAALRPPSEHHHERVTKNPAAG